MNTYYLDFMDGFLQGVRRLRDLPDPIVAHIIAMEVRTEGEIWLNVRELSWRYPSRKLFRVNTNLPYKNAQNLFHLDLRVDELIVAQAIGEVMEIL